MDPEFKGWALVIVAIGVAFALARVGVAVEKYVDHDRAAQSRCREDGKRVVLYTGTGNEWRCMEVSR